MSLLAISMLVHYGIVSIGFFAAIAIAGIGLTQFTVLAGALGVGIGFGLQNLVNNFVSGLILSFERPIKVGDTIEIGTMLGTVRQIGIRSSIVRTLDGAEVIVPNGNLISNDLINWTLSDRRRRIEVKIGAAYGTDPTKVLQILRDAADTNDDVSSHPSPSALFLGFGESSLDFALRCWTPEFDDWYRVRSNLTVEVNNAFKEAGIEIPYPQRDLHVRSVASSIGLTRPTS